MKKFTKRVGVFVMIICLSFCFGGCTIFPSSGSDWPDGQKPEYQRPAGDNVVSEPGEPAEDTIITGPAYWEEEHFEGYSDVYSGVISAYVPSVREEGNKTSDYELARVKFNSKVAEQYAVMSEYILYSLLGKYGGGAVDKTLSFDIGKAGVLSVNANVINVPSTNDSALYTTMGAIERSIDGVVLSPSKPSTIEECENAEIVANINIENKWLCNMGVGVDELTSDYNESYVAKYKGYLQIRLMEEVLNSTTKTTLTTYNAWTQTQISGHIVDLSKQIPNIGIEADSVLNSKVQSIVLNEIIGSVALARSTASISVKERFEYSYPSEIKYSLGEIEYEDDNVTYKTTQATTQLGMPYLEGGNVVNIVVTGGEKLYYASGNPVIVDIVIGETTLKAHASVGDSGTLTEIPDSEVTNYTRELDVNRNGVIDINGYTTTSIYGYTYSSDVSEIVGDMLDFASTIHKVDGREYVAIDSTKYYSPITQPETGKLADLENVTYQDYTSAIVYNKQYAFPWIMSVGIQSKENLVVDVYIRVRKTYVEGLQQKTVTQVLKLGTMHTDSTKDFYWEGESSDDEDVDYDTLVANTMAWDICTEFGKLLPEVTQDDLLDENTAFVDEDGVLQYSITDIDFSKEKFKNYRYLYYMQVQGMTPPVSGNNVVTEVVSGSAEVEQLQGYYQGNYERYVSTDTLSGTAGDNQQVTFSQNLVVYNDQNSSEDYIEIIFDVTNKDKVTDSTFKFIIEQVPFMEEEEE